MDKLREFVREAYNKAIESENEIPSEPKFKERNMLMYMTGAISVKIENEYGINADEFLEFMRFMRGDDNIDCYLYKQYNQCEHGVEEGHYCPECL